VWYLPLIVPAEQRYLLAGSLIAVRYIESGHHRRRDWGAVINPAKSPAAATEASARNFLATGNVLDCYAVSRSIRIGPPGTIPSPQRPLYKSLQDRLWLPPDVHRLGME
jgi:hypothetical protein